MVCIQIRVREQLEGKCLVACYLDKDEEGSDSEQKVGSAIQQGLQVILMEMGLMEKLAEFENPTEELKKRVISHFRKEAE